MSTTNKRDYYEVLGVSQEAGEEELRRAYRALAREYHPDVAGEPEAEERWQELVEAYGTLSNPERKLLYDRFGFRGRGFGDALAAAAAVDGDDEDAAAAGPDVVLELGLGFYEARRGTTRTVRLEAESVCPYCNDAGGETEPCGECDGTGSLRTVSDREVGRLLRVDTCDICGGSGQLVIEACEECSGTGRLQESRVVRVRIPAGVEDGQTVRVRGEGNPSEDDGETGDAFIVLRVGDAPPARTFVRYVARLLLLAALGLLVFLALH